MQGNIAEVDRKVEDVMDTNGEEGTRSCGVVGYCRRTVILKKLKAK